MLGKGSTMLCSGVWCDNLLGVVAGERGHYALFVGVWCDTVVLIQEGPMVEGVPPKEASDRLSIFQTRFDELWRKYQIYTDGEELFGLPVTQYEDLVRIKKEFNLLQKLYGLFNTVMDSIDGYFDILWTEVDIEKINNELLDFQNK